MRPGDLPRPGCPRARSVAARNPPQRIHRLPVHVADSALPRDRGAAPTACPSGRADVDDDREAPSALRTKHVGVSRAPSRIGTSRSFSITRSWRGCEPRRDLANRCSVRAIFDLDLVLADEFRPRLRLGTNLIGELLRRGRHAQPSSAAAQACSFISGRDSTAATAA